MMKMDRGNILKQLQKIQDDMKKTQEELASQVIEGSAGRRQGSGKVQW